MAAPIDDAGRRDYLQREVAADLLFVWDEASVSLVHQYELGQNYKSVRKFAALGDTKVQVRQAFTADLRVDPDAGAASRAEMACLVTAWQVAVEMTEREIGTHCWMRMSGFMEDWKNERRLLPITCRRRWRK